METRPAEAEMVDKFENQILSSVGVGKSCVLPIRVPNPSPTLDKNLASMGTGILSSIGVEVWRKAPEAFPDSNTTLDTFQSARRRQTQERRNIYHHSPESKKRKSSEGNSGSIHPCGRYRNAGKTSKTISTIAILWPLKAIFEKRAPTVEVDTFVSPAARYFAALESAPGKRVGRGRVQAFFFT